MRKQAYTPQKATTQLMAVIAKGVKENRRLSDIDDAIRTVVNSYVGLNRRERARLFRNASENARRVNARGIDELASRTAYDSFMSTSRKVMATSDTRNKMVTLSSDMADFENEKGYEPIFFACSYHSNCSCGHENFQGKIYVDRFWRMKVRGTDYYRVLSYIKNRNIQTVQSVVKAPIWLTTRPYCRHYFVPVPTADVLGSSPKKILHDCNAYHYTPDYYTNDEYFRIRSDVYTELNQIVPSAEFKTMIERSRHRRH